MIAIEWIREAAEVLRGSVVRTPLILFPEPHPGGEGAPEIHLKLETLQGIGSFKIRGAMNLVRHLPEAEARAGFWTASAGNMAQAAAETARRLGVPCTVVVPDSAPRGKVAAVERLGGKVLKVPFEKWWQAMEQGAFPGLVGRFLPPFDDELVMAGNGTIGLEILEDLPDVDTVLVPWGGGGLACGIASALRVLRPGVRVYAVEVATAAPLAPSLAARSPRTVERVPSFVDGIGGSAVFPRMFERARTLLAGSLVAELGEIEEAIRLMVARVRVVAEGAGACPLAVALAPRFRDRLGKKVACVVSGGNIDTGVLTGILAGASR